jgi:Tfp pilus assembly protein PilV
VRILKDKGMTLMEMVVIIVVIGIAIPVLMRMWSDIAISSADSETISDVTFLAQELMEEIKSKRFVDPEEPDNTALGPNGGDKDDVDDYNNATPETLAGGYTRKVNVRYRYVDPADNAWKDSSSVTDYKYIRVTVESSKTTGGSFPLSTIVAREQ